MARYRKISPYIWNDDKFRELSDDAKLVFLFLLTHPHLTAIGAMRASIPGLASELGWTEKGFREPFAEPLSKGMVRVDERACLIWLPKFLNHNPPDNPNTIKAWAKSLEFLPECELKTELIAHLKQFIEQLPEPFRKAFSEQFAKQFGNGSSNGMPNKELELRTGTGTGSPFPTPSPRRGSKQPDPKNFKDWKGGDTSLEEHGGNGGKHRSEDPPQGDMEVVRGWGPDKWNVYEQVHGHEAAEELRAKCREDS